ncbi:MAG TPA: FAD-dependent monooxygenase [Lentimicrobium sp.]|nr:FAD-dependent monooxygenase [Lentimicrobium sp.]
MANSNYDVEVLIAGAGPTGLMIACQLLSYNISFRIIDKKASPQMHSGALILHSRTLEILDEMGLAYKAIEAGIIAQSINIQFNSTKITSIDISNIGVGLTRFPFFLMLEQWKTEKLLIEFLKAKDLNIENSTELISFTINDEIVTSETINGNGEIQVIKSKFLIGADGPNSFVRKHLGIPFPGKTHQHRLFITDCEAKLPIPQKEILFSFTNRYALGCFPLNGNRWRIDGLIPSIQQKEYASFEDVKYFFGTNKGSMVELQNSQWFSVFRSHSRCAATFRYKQCFLVGDAAHVHTPVGAQGMNTGMQDSYNLACKLALYIQGKATEALLNTYEEERRPLALKNIRYTDFAYSVMTSGTFIARFFRLHFFPMLLPFFISRLKKKTSLQIYIFKVISGIDIKNGKRVGALNSANNGLASYFYNK